MHKSSLVTLSLVLFWMLRLPSIAYPQEWGGWNLMNLKGEVAVESRYKRQSETLSSGESDELNSSELIANIDIDTRSYVFHPNFMLLDINGIYSPGQRKDSYLIIPDRTESTNTSQLRIKSIFFNERPLSGTLFGTKSQSLINRDIVSSLDVNRESLGGSVSFRNAYLPVFVDFTHDNEEQNELETDRKFDNYRDVVKLRADKSFGELDKHNFVYSYDDFRRSYTEHFATDSKVHTLSLIDRIFFDEELQNSYFSRVWFYDQGGTQKLRRFQITQDGRLQLPSNLTLRGSYSLTNLNHEEFDSLRNEGRLSLEHELFESLKSRLFLEASDVNQTFDDEFSNKVGLGFNYKKKIPTSGILRLSFQHEIEDISRASAGSFLNIIDEEHELSDLDTVFLENPFVVPSSVIVTDSTGTIIYEENFDYIIVERGTLTEIQRIPGGEISDGDTVLVDYHSDQQIDYDLRSGNILLGSSVSFFRNLLRLSYRHNEFNFTKASGTGIGSLREYSQDIYGIDLNYAFLSGGVSYENLRSTIVPYRSTDYYATLSHLFFSKLLTSLNANYRDQFLTDENEHQKFTNLTGRITYMLSPRTKINLIGNKRIQDGRDLDLDVTNYKAEFLTRFRKVFLTVGAERYSRNYLNEQLSYNSFYFKLGRKIGG